MNNLPLRLNPSGNPTFRKLAMRVREATIDACDEGGGPGHFELTAAADPDVPLARLRQLVAGRGQE